MEQNLDNEWPDIEVEEKFDWSLSLKELQRRYGQRIGQRGQGKGIQPRWPVDTEPYFKISREKKIEKIKQQLGWPPKPGKATNIIKNNPGLSLTEFIDKLNAEPEPNFHEPPELNDFIVKLNLHNATFFNSH